MASLLLFRRPLLSPVFIGIGLTAIFAARPFSNSRVLYCDASPSPSSPFRNYAEDARVPVVRNGRINPVAYKQISGGSILGLIGGLAVSMFSRTLAFLFGLVVCGAQYAASKGYNVLPTDRVQSYVKGINLRSAVEDNVAFKMSFGTSFMLAAFASF